MPLAVVHFISPFAHAFVGATHAPAEHALRPHAFAQLPHRFGSVFGLLHVPLHATVAGSHVATHAPFTQLLPATQLRALGACPLVRSAPHPPQFCASVCVFAHAPLQAVSPLPQASPQAPPLHAALPAPNVGPGQTVAHAPQLLTSVMRLTHAF